MFKRIWQTALFVIGLSLIAVGQLTAIANWPSFFNSINAVLIVLIFCLFFLGFRATTWAVLISGFWLDIFSFNFFGLYLITLFLVILIADRISVSLLTNRSLYSFLLLILVSTIIYNFIFQILGYFSVDTPSSLFLVQKSFWLTLAYQSAWSVVCAVLMFNLSALLTRRLQPFFLEKKTIL
ncbi:MAG: rod shape-determining protein MreD [Patescibacteria group bacterium]|jgi:cell shape-determining protein MreD